ncbi:MAG: 16S rRNA (cytosine(1402)-N(4))-methyltransferase RsmH [Actinomycetota bacterium]
MTQHDTPAFAHRPVMVDEIVALASEAPPGYLLDATLGGGGHATAVLAQCPELTVIGLDQDPMAIEAATTALAPFAGRAVIRRRRFDGLADVMAELDVAELSGFLFDLGVSSPQLDRGERGFSFRNDGPLDMRMDPRSATSAADVVNTYPEADLASVLRRYADERNAGRIAAAIVAARPLSSTAQLAQIVVDATPAAARRGGGPHPATRTFQAIRIEVNRELDVLRPALDDALDALGVDGRGMVLTYHSGEDRIVKDVFRQRSTSVDPPGLPVPVSPPSYRVGRPPARRPSDAEQVDNPRSTSARLRSIERIAA